MTTKYRDEESPLPPIGTHVVHEIHGPGVIASVDSPFGQWLIRFDEPFHEGGRLVEEAWTFPHNLRPGP
jgi:hypothetical protein